ncbi:DNA repair protein RecO C-terminal domain-containing protein, partial [Streptomyces prasinopilosus]|uniref:DNA repair protein RecO C-terminal domain-containing protein n=1 Tax=Streptomyces prasinopilosus TaxID=67344 RepID=UPI000B09B82E
PRLGRVRRRPDSRAQPADQFQGLRRGHADCRVPGSVVPSPQALELLGALLAGDWETADASEARYVREGSGLVSAYLHWHLERGLRSLRYVEK